MDADTLADINKLDAVVRQLGIGESFIEPAVAVAKLQDDLERLQRERDDLVAFLSGIGRQAAEMAKSYKD